MYAYYGSGHGDESRERNKQSSIELGQERANPSNCNPDKVILGERKRAFESGLGRLSETGLSALDIGGRIQPFRHLLGERVISYIAVDRQIEGLTDVVATGEELPFRDGEFDLVICTQMLSYVADPAAVIREAQRVLKRGGSMFLTAPAWFPEHHDECWRFLPGGLQVLLTGWRDIEILPEGNSAVGALRTIAIVINDKCQGRVMAAVSRKLLIPFLNMIAAKMVTRNTNSALVANYSVWATK